MRKERELASEPPIGSNGESSLAIPGLREGSVLYVSAVVAEHHPLHRGFRSRAEPPPEIDLARILESSGRWVRRYFAPRVIDGTLGRGVLPRRLDGYSGLVVGGSLHTCLLEDRELEPWQRDLVALIRTAVLDFGLPYLGLCGGGQLGLLALGGNVRSNPAGLAGPGSPAGALLVRTGMMRLTEDGLEDPIFKGCPAEVPMLESHKEWLAELPPGARVLANSDDLPQQVVAWGDGVRLFQPHPELTVGYVRRLLEEMAPDMEDPAPILAAASRLTPTPVANRRIVRNFLTELCAGRG